MLVGFGRHAGILTEHLKILLKKALDTLSYTNCDLMAIIPQMWAFILVLASFEVM